MSSAVYWIHHPSHTDMFTQGYIGITKHFERRMHEHKIRCSNPHMKYAINKYGWDNLIKEIIVIADEAYCLMLETILRNANAIGWNIVKGGGKPPIAIKGTGIGRKAWNKGLKTPEYVKIKLSISHKGKEPGNKGHKGKQIAWNKGIPMRDSTKQKLREIFKIKMTGYKHKIVECPHCHKQGGSSGMGRHHMNNCKFKKEIA